MFIDPKSNVPIYRQIVDQTRDLIDAGVHRAGEALPSLRALAIEIHVNPNTVQRAYDELERLGLVESRRGLGVFVRDRDSKLARGRIEKSIAKTLGEAIAVGLKEQVAPARLRELFESELNARIARARNQT